MELGVLEAWAIEGLNHAIWKGLMPWLSQLCDQDGVADHGDIADRKSGRNGPPVTRRAAMASPSDGGGVRAMASGVIESGTAPGLEAHSGSLRAHSRLAQW